MALESRRELPDTREPVSNADYSRIAKFLDATAPKPTVVPPPPPTSSLIVSYHGDFLPRSPRA